MNSPCASNATCQAGFGDKGYRCVCPQGYHGDQCDLVLSKCPPSWIAFNESCYTLSADEKDWNNAKAFCNVKGGQLAKIETANENDFIKGKFPAGKADYWIGLTDEEIEDYWKWTDGSELTGYINWRPGQPNDLNGQDCIAIRKGLFGNKEWDGEWHDLACSKERKFICEM
ncbi:hypothetical protein ACROYT_G022775 [Oculina patagonica]